MKTSPHLPSGSRIERSALAIACAAVLAVPIESSAVVISNNLDQRPDGVEAVDRNRWVASKFSTDEKNYLLTDVAMRLRRTLAGTLEAALYTDNNGKPGQLVAVLKGPGSIPATLGDVVFTADGVTGNFTRKVNAQDASQLVLPAGLDPKDLPKGEFNVSGEQPQGIGLAPNTAYWVVTRAQSGEFAAAYTDSEAGKGVGYTSEWARSGDAGGQWDTREFSPLLFSAHGELEVAILELRTDEEAIASAIFSGLPVALVQTEIAISAAQSATRDVNSRLYRRRTGEKQETGVEAFAAGKFHSTDIDAAGRSTGAEGDTFTTTLGVEWRPSANFALGVAVTHLESDDSLAFGLGDVSLSGNAISAYASVAANGFYGDVLYSYMHVDHEIRRETLFGGLATAEPESEAHRLEITVGYNREVAGFVVGGFAGMDYVNGDVAGYTERGSTTANVRVGGQDFESLVGRIGLNISRTFETQGFEITPQLRVAYAHEFLNDAQDVRADLVQSPFEIGDGRNFTRFGSFSAGANTHPRGEDWLELGAAIGFAVSERLRFILDYDARVFQGDSRIHSIGLTGSWSF